MSHFTVAVFHREDQNIDELLAPYDENLSDTYNPNAKWDWYCVGGRWADYLKLKPEKRAGYGGFSAVDEARVGDIDFNYNLDVYRDALRFWDIVVDGKPVPEGEEKPFSIYKAQYYLDYYGDRETYARHIAQWSTFAVITPDGTWHEKGEMGWFGCSSDTPEEAKRWEEGFRERFIDAADPDWILTMVDCHI